LHFEESLVLQDILVLPKWNVLAYGVCGVLLKGRLFAVRVRSEADS
jgi:hypothetical protein